MAEQARMNAEEAAANPGSAEEAADEAEQDTSIVAKEVPTPKTSTPKKEERIGPGAILVAILTLPVLAMLAFGLYAGGFGLFTLGFAMYKAWQLTDGQGLDLQLKGPFRVGTGPIQPTL
jgi:hypothetical protein